MRIVLYKITSKSGIKQPVVRHRKLFPSKIKICLETLMWEYWIEYRIDENRFWYGERKPVWNDDLEAYEIKEHYIMTKNGLDKSVKIVKDIRTRSSYLAQNCVFSDNDLRFTEWEHENIKLFYNFDKHANSNDKKYSLGDLVLLDNNLGDDKYE